MRRRIKRHAVLVAANNMAALLDALLGGIVMLFTKRLPVGFIPEELLRFRYLLRVATVKRLFKFVRLDVVNDCSRNGPALPVAHHAERVSPEECQSGFIPAAVVDA